MPYKYTHKNSKFTKEQKDFYEKNGYILMKNNISHELLDELHQRFIDICELKTYSFSAQVIKDPVLKSQGASGQFCVNKIQDFLYDDILWKYCSNKNIIDVVENIIGPNITIINSMLINKPPNSHPDVSKHPLHQDLHYFPFRPVDTICASWTAMERIDENNGCLFVIPGSHTHPLYKHEYPTGIKHLLYYGVQNMDHLPRTNIVMEKGDTVFFHPLILHGSGANHTKGFRKAISCHFADSFSYFINPVDRSQAENFNEIEETIGYKTGGNFTIRDYYKGKSRLVRGPPGIFQEYSSHL